MEWEEFLLSEEFKAYRKRQAKVVAETVHGALSNLRTEDAERLKGALEMAVKLIRLPREIVADDPKILSQISKQIEQDMADVSACLISKRFTSHEDDD